MRKLWNSNLGRRLSCLALVLVMVLSLLPVRASAVTVANNVEVLTGEATMFGGSDGDLAFNFDKLELEWYPKDEIVGRNQDGWWIGIRVTMPDGIVPEAATFTTQRFDGAESEKISFKDARDGENNVITLWAFIDEETAHTYANSSSNSYMIYRFYWWKGEENRAQGIRLNLPAQVLTLKKDGKVVYNGTWENSNGTVSVPEGYTYDRTGVACAPEVELALTSTVPHQQGGWFADFEITKPGSAKKKAQYREKGAEKGTKIGVEKLTVKTLLAADAESAKDLHDVKKAWEFDWDGDGTYEQTVTVRVAASARLERNFKFSAPIDDTVTVPQEKALVATTGVEGATTITSKYIKGDGTTEIKQENGQYYVTFNKPGTIKITASAPDDGVFAAAKDSYTFPVTRDEQAISFDMTDPWIVVNVDPRYTTQTYRQTAKNTLGRTVTYSIEKQTTPEGEYATIATIDSANGQMTILRSGEITVRAETPKDDRYEASSATYTLTVKRAKDDSILTFDVETSEANPAQVIYGKKEYYIKPDGHEGNVSLTNGLPEGLLGWTFTDQGLRILLKDNATGLFTISFTRAADEKYEAVTKNFYLQISYAQAPDPAYVVTGETKNNSGWYTGPVTVSAPEGWELSAIGNKLWGNTSWTKALPAITADGTYAKENIYLRHMNGNITDAIERREIKIDQTAPTRLSSRAYKKVGDQILEILSFGLFNAEIHYELSAQDATSGVEKFEYWFVDENGKVVEGKGGEVAVDKKGKAEFVVQPDLKGTLHFVAYDAAGNCSVEMQGNEIVLEKTPPVCEAVYFDPVSQNGTTRYYGNGTTVSLTLTDNERLMLSDNGMPDATVRVNGVETAVGWVLVSEQEAFASVDLTQEGTHTITVTAKDAAGNEGSFTSDPIVIDRTHAVASAAYAEPVSQNGTTRYYSGDTTVTLTLTDNERLMLIDGKPDATVKVDGEETTADWTVSPDGKTAEATIPLTEVGTHTVTVTAKDAAGNRMPEFTTDPQVIDRTALTAGAEYSKEISRNGTTRYYDGDAAVTLTLTDDERLMLTDGKIDAVVKVDGAETAVDWTVSADGKTATATITFTKEGVHTATVTAKDAAGNEMPEFTTEPQVIDRTAPIAGAQYADPMGSTDDTLYYAGPFTATLKVTDTNLDPADITVMDNGEVVSGLVWAQDANDPAVWTAVCTVSGEGEHILTMTARDRAKNEMEPYTSPNLLIIDQTPPVSEVKYADPMGGTDDVLYYGGAFKVTLSITDVNLDPADITVMDNGEVVSGLEWKPEGKRPTVWTAICTVSGEGEHTVTMTALDRAKNEMEPFTSKKLIIDETAPIAGAQYAEPKSSRDEKDYYDGEFEARFTVTDVNLDPADITVMDNGAEITGLVWTQDEADPTVWTASCTVSGEGEHTLTMTAHDRAKNEMTPYTSPKILVIDQTAPVINVIYANTDVKNVIDGISYFDREQTATIEITEANFSAENVTLTVTAKDVTGKDIATEDFLAALHDAQKWSHENGKHTITVRFPVEANYTLSVACTDLAGRKAEDYDPDAFTVDATAPSNLGISYSTSLLDRVLEGVTFGYYNAPVTVTLTADDTVSGVHGILYSYAKALNVSGVNAELLNDAISAAEIRRNGYTFTATFTIPKAVLTAANQFNGTVSFTATDRSGNAASYTDGRRTVVDTIRPAVEVTLTDPARKDGTTAYYAGTAGVTAKVNEANFYAEDVVFEVTRNGAAYPVSANWTNNSADLHTGTFSLTQEGEYVVKMRYTDRSGNVMEDYVSDTLIVDTTVPELTVTGVDADSANKDTPFGFVITAKDAHLDPDTLTVTLTAVVRDENGKYATKTVKLDPAEIVKAGEEYRITVKNLTEDAVYSLTCTVADRSGNVQKTFALHDGKEHEKISFSVNRNGSTFSVDENTAALLEQYYTYDVRNDVVIFETNVDPVEHYTVKLNGKELTEGTDYTTTLSTEPGKWALRTYTLNKNLFVTEGGYNVVVESTDKTNTVAYSDVKSLDISFVVDQTAPVLTVSGLKTGGRYQTTEQTVTVIPTDDGGRLNSFRALVLDSDGTPLRNAAGEDVSVRFDLSGDELHDYLKEHDGMITFTVPEGLENQVRLICGDCAAHADGTTNVCDELYERVTVSSNLFIIFFANKGLFYGTLGVLALLIVLIIFLIARKKRKSSKK
jgi:hypothetical protein